MQKVSRYYVSCILIVILRASLTTSGITSADRPRRINARFQAMSYSIIILPPITGTGDMPQICPEITISTVISLICINARSVVVVVVEEDRASSA